LCMLGLHHWGDTRLDAFRSAELVRAMTAREIWAFVRDEVPALVEALR